MSVLCLSPLPSLSHIQATKSKYEKVMERVNDLAFRMYHGFDPTAPFSGITFKLKDHRSGSYSQIVRFSSLFKFDAALLDHPDLRPEDVAPAIGTLVERLKNACKYHWGTKRKMSSFLSFAKECLFHCSGRSSWINDTLC